jgi:hypothetical protein
MKNLSRRIEIMKILFKYLIALIALGPFFAITAFSMLLTFFIAIPMIFVYFVMILAGDSNRASRLFGFCAEDAPFTIWIDYICYLEDKWNKF